MADSFDRNFTKQKKTLDNPVALFSVSKMIKTFSNLGNFASTHAQMARLNRKVAMASAKDGILESLDFADLDLAAHAQSKADPKRMISETLTLISGISAKKWTKSCQTSQSVQG